MINGIIKRTTLRLSVVLFFVFVSSLFFSCVMLDSNVNASTQGGVLICNMSGSNCKRVQWKSESTWDICDENGNNCETRIVSPYREYSVNGPNGTTYILKNSIDSVCALGLNNNPNNCWEMEGTAGLSCEWNEDLGTCHVESSVNKNLVWNVGSNNATVDLVVKPLGKLQTELHLNQESFESGSVKSNDITLYNAKDYSNIYVFNLTKDQIKDWGEQTERWDYDTNGNRFLHYSVYRLRSCVQYHWKGGSWSSFWQDSCDMLNVRETHNDILTFNGTSSVTNVNGEDVSDKQWFYDGNSNSKTTDAVGVKPGNVTIGFNHKVKNDKDNDVTTVPMRTEIGTQVRVSHFDSNGSIVTTNDWINYYGPGGNRTDEAWQRIQTYNINNTLKIDDTVSVDIKLGEQIEVCQRIAYDDAIRIKTIVNEDGSKTTTTQPLEVSWRNSYRYDVLKDENGNEKVAVLPSAYSGWSCVTLRGINNLNVFNGISTVKYSDSLQKTTDWVTLNKTVKMALPREACGNGCPVQFSHGLSRKSYETIEANSNYILHRVSTNRTGVPFTHTTISGSVGGTPKSWPYDDSVKLSNVTVYPGQIICEWLEFDSKVGSIRPNSTAIDYRSRATTMACAYVEAEFDSTIDVKIKNDNVAEWGQYTDDMVYARPGNNLYLQGTYSPNYQHTKDFIPDYTRFSSSGYGYKNDGMTLAQVMLKYYSTYPWQNAFMLYTRNELNCNSSTNSIFTSSPGTDNNYSGVTRFEVSGESVGSRNDAFAITNACYNKTTRTTPQSVKFIMSSNNNFTATVNADSLSDVAKYAVPYNFNTEIVVPKPKETEKIIYAGEKKDISGFQVKVTKRQNGRFNNESYATIMKDAEVRLISYVGSEIKGGETGKNVSGKDLCNASFGGSSNCTNVVLKQGNGSSTKWTFNSKYDINGGDPTTISKATVTATDARAGTQYCVALAVYPSSSGDPDVHDSNGDLQMDTSGSKRWRISDSVCYTVAKKPSLQVWGGNFYSSKNVTTAVSTKYILNGDNSSNPPYIFGSWVEGAIVSNGEVRGLASGASTGYRQANSSMGLGGISKNTNFCYRSPLSFAAVSSNCSSSAPYVGNLGKSTEPGDKAEILERFVSYDNSEAAKTAGIVKDENDYIVLDGDTTIDDSFVNERLRFDGNPRTVVIRAANNKNKITINSNIIIDNGGPFSSLSNVPKIIIYANGDINISCNVTRIDALLISDETVRTCSEISDNISDNNDKQQSNQLKINGAIIANKLIARRTYGASTGKNSVIPAEIVDYDSTFYLWGAKNAEAAKSGTLSNVYLRELSPRY